MRAWRRLALLAASVACQLALSGLVAAAEFSGYIGAGGRWFPARPVDPEQASETASLVVQPEAYFRWDDGRQTLAVTLFARADARDDERTHADIRELSWEKSARTWRLSAGLRKVFWGVTESQHLVDIINQTDLVEDLDGEEKLGQPMVQGSLLHPWGKLDLFVMPRFRERTFPGPEGRPRSRPRVDGDRARYESAAGREHVDLAVRWSQSVGPWDIGLAHFRGTGREPRLLPAFDPSGQPVLLPFYEQIDQTSLDLQATTGPWLLKLEALTRRDSLERFAALTGGFEYTFGDVAGSGIDVGILAEYLYDDRGRLATTPFEHDVFVGTRVVLNDVQGTDLLAGAIVDLDPGGTLFSLEGNRRLGERWRLRLEARGFEGFPSTDPLHAFRRDHYLQVELLRYF